VNNAKNTHTKHRNTVRTEAFPIPAFPRYFSKKMLSSIVMAAADRCAGDKDRATRCRPHARAGVQACRDARASSSNIPVVERRGWRPIHKRKAEDA